MDFERGFPIRVTLRTASCGGQAIGPVALKRDMVVERNVKCWMGNGEWGMGSFEIEAEWGPFQWGWDILYWGESITCLEECDVGSVWAFEEL